MKTLTYALVFVFLAGIFVVTSPYFLYSEEVPRLTQKETTIQKEVTESIKKIEGWEYQAYISPFALSISNIVNFKLSVESSAHPKPAQDVLLQR
jgi:hypothetical protein